MNRYIYRMPWGDTLTFAADLREPSTPSQRRSSTSATASWRRENGTAGTARRYQPSSLALASSVSAMPTETGDASTSGRARRARRARRLWSRRCTSWPTCARARIRNDALEPVVIWNTCLEASMATPELPSSWMRVVRLTKKSRNGWGRPPSRSTLASIAFGSVGSKPAPMDGAGP